MPREDAEALLRRARVLRLCMADHDGPYVVPLNFGYSDGRIYVHGAMQGRRIDAIAQDPRVCFEVDEGEVVPAERPCGYTARFESVVGYGRARLLETAEEKRYGLEVLMRHYGGPTEGFDDDVLEKTSVVEIAIETMDAKRHEVKSGREGSEMRFPELSFDERGLIPAVVQQHDTGEVLMVAWMDAEALRRTIETGTTWFWSRSRQTHWNKGATSGNIQRVREIRYDCDADTLLVIVDQTGVACHTGARSCFFRTLQPEAGVGPEDAGDEGQPLS